MHQKAFKKEPFCPLGVLLDVEPGLNKSRCLNEDKWLILLKQKLRKSQNWCKFSLPLACFAYPDQLMNEEFGHASKGKSA